MPILPPLDPRRGVYNSQCCIIRNWEKTPQWFEDVSLVKYTTFDYFFNRIDSAVNRDSDCKRKMTFTLHTWF